MLVIYLFLNPVLHNRQKTCVTAALTLIHNPDVAQNEHRLLGRQTDRQTVFVVSHWFLPCPPRSNHRGLLVRSLAFPSLQPSLVQSFSPFPILQCTNRKRRAEPGPSAGTDRAFVSGEKQSEYHGSRRSSAESVTLGWRVLT